ncbi:MAG TPA: LCP family protein, partial [Candidatus Limnocylindrales bacterium]|nr:LCP family protein [Candidatus Limnocylindrales bacterium]
RPLGADMTVEGDRIAPPRRSAPSASPGVAAFLSFIIPGLGQLAVGSVRRGLILGLPLVLTILVGLFVVVADHKALFGVVQPSVILALIALDVLLGLIHLVAIGDAYQTARQRVVRSAWPPRPGSPKVLAVLLLVTLVIHGALGAIGVQAYNAVNAVFQLPGTGYTIPTPSFSAAPGESPLPTNPPTQGAAPAWAADGRLNVLLIGGDAGPGRWNLRTDTMIVMSADLATGRVALFGIPRNLINAPLAPEDAAALPGGTFPDLLNALWVYADGHRKQFPGGDSAGFRAITGSIQQLVGVPLDGAVVVKLNGFVDLVDALGGLWINVESPIHDDHYPLEDGSGYVKLNLKAGCQHFNGHFTLAYARSRHASDDYNRMGRQQEVLEDIAKQVDPISLITQVPHLLDLAGTNLKTTFAPADIPGLAEFASSVDRTHIKNILFAPPKYREYLTAAEIGQIQKVVRNVFVTPPPKSPAPSVSPTASSAHSPSPSHSSPPPATCPPS